MEIEPRKPTIRGPAESFTGEVWIDSIAQAHGSSPSMASRCGDGEDLGVARPAVCEPEEGTRA
jgi:hypothetical protein